ncbi:hypothetical protein [Aliamphritea spongicola]|nr:hypothetical protein [Aliamphritea spongicola]
MSNQFTDELRLTTVPLISGHIRGVLVLLEKHSDSRDQQRAFVEALAGFAANCLEHADHEKLVADSASSLLLPEQLYRYLCLCCRAFFTDVSRIIVYRRFAGF